MRRTAILTTSLAILTTFAALPAPAAASDDATLRGSSYSMVRQNRVAKQHDYTFLRTPAQVSRFVDEGYLVPVEERGALRVANVSHPYARPEMRLFLERLSAQYRAGCGEDLVVTSLVRPTSRQPRNSHPLSVHPTGMAVDLRVSRTSGACVRWLESTLLSLEEQGLLDVTREYRPPHFHVALFPSAYHDHATRLIADSVAAAVREREQRLARFQAERPAVHASLLPAPASQDGDPAPEQRQRRTLIQMASLALVVLGAGAWRAFGANWEW